MKKIVKGNDFIMRIPVMKIVDGEKQAFPLPACTDIMVRLCSAFRRYELTYTIDAKDDNVLLARVEGDKMPCGSYALEVRGKVFGNDWRSNEYEQLIIVDNNEKADTEFGKTDEGENSVEMDTAIVYLPPSAELSGLITEAQETVKTVTALNEQVTVSEEERAKSEESRVQAEQARVSQEAERVQAEGTRTKTEIEREANELTRKNNEAKRQDNETARQIAEGKRETDTTSAISAMKTKTDSAIASMDEHRTAFDNAEAARVGNEEARQANEQARITAEAKRESDMAQAVEKANSASDIAISANEPFVWMPFADLEHWNITAMDLTTGTVTLDTEEHGLAVGDSVTIAAKITDWSGNYSIGRQWESCLSSSRMKNFPVTRRGAIPSMDVTAVNGKEIQMNGLKVSSTSYVPTPSDWQLQRVPTKDRTIALPARFKGKPVTITVEGQFVSYDNSWSFYHARTALLDQNGEFIFKQLGDPVCGLPFVKQMASMRAGHIMLVDIGANLYGEGVALESVRLPVYVGNKYDGWDVGDATTLYMERLLGHYATRVIVTPYQELTKLGGGDDELKQMTALKRQWFAANAMLSREYWLPTYLFDRDSYEYVIPMRSGFYCKVKVLDHEATMCIAGGYVYSSAESARALNYLWVKDGRLAYNPTIGTKALETTDYVFDNDWHEVYVSWGDMWDRTWIDGVLVMEHTGVTCRKNDTGKIYVFGYNALDHRINVPDVGAAVIQGPVLFFWDGEVKAWHCGLSAKEDDDVERSTVMSCPTMHTFNGTIHDGQGGTPTADCTGLIHCEGTGNRAWINIFGVWKEI